MTSGIRKIGAMIAVSEEDLAHAETLRYALTHPPSQEQRQQAEQQHRDRITALKADHAALVADTPWVMRGVTELHAPDDDGTCAGCDFDGGDAERPEWPCRTIDTIREALPNPGREAP